MFRSQSRSYLSQPPNGLITPRPAPPPLVVAVGCGWAIRCPLWLHEYMTVWQLAVWLDVAMKVPRCKSKTG